MRTDQFPKPFFRAARNAWFVQIGGKQVRLDADKDTAFRRYHELMARPPEQRVITPPQSSGLLIPVLDAFLEWTKANQAPKTYTWYRDHIQRFTSGIPKLLTVVELKPYHVTQVMDTQTAWSASTKNGFARNIQRALRWAENQGLIDRNPIPKLEKPANESREVVITPAEFVDLLAQFPDQPFRDLLTTAWETGCRPNELFRVEARHVDRENRRWTFKIKESKGKRRARHVYLSDKALEITERLMRAHSVGPLFRNAGGEPWTKDTVNRRFLRKKAALGRKLCLYHIRHSFGNRMLLAGVDALTVATWMGHQNTNMLARHYGHLDQNPAYLAAKLQIDAKPAGA